MSGPTLAEPENSRRGWVRWCTIVFGVAVFAAVGLQLGLQSAYADRFYPGTKIAGQSVGGETRAEAAQALDFRTQSFGLDVQVGGNHYQVKSSDLGVSYDIEATVESAYMNGHSETFTPLGLWRADHSHNSYAYEVDNAAQKQLVAKIVAQSGQAPVDATVAVNNGVPEVLPDKNGLEVSEQDLQRDFSQAIASGGHQIINAVARPQPAHVRVPAAQGAVQTAKKLIATPVSLQYQDRAFSPTAADIGAWLSFVPTSENAAPGVTVQVDPTKVQNYLNAIAKSINVKPVVRKVNVQNGVSSEVQAGQNGLAVDVETLAQQISQDLQAGKSLSTVPIPTVPVAFQTQYNRTITLDYGRYVEVNLSLQHLWVYQDHQVVFDSPITSGATGAGFPTATGLFAIYAKETNRHLVGYQYGPRYNYDVFVQYWMPFYQGFGLHDASWRSSFGGQDYYYGGSHGCINLPLSTAAWLFNWADVGTPVWVHT
jgi:lipoprotein-anchoring transpeptidase ErfK/SrfK